MLALAGLFCYSLVRNYNYSDPNKNTAISGTKHEAGSSSHRLYSIIDTCANVSETSYMNKSV